MTPLPQPHISSRSPRLRLSDITPVVLRFSDGHRTPVELEVISLTGGLLRMPKPVDHGSRVSMMFLTRTGPVLGQAEMLNPVSWTEQPFRFVAIQSDDQRRLRAAIQSSAVPEADEQEWIDKYRAALDAPPPRGKLLRKLLAAVTVLTIGLAGFVYFFGLHLNLR